MAEGDIGKGPLEGPKAKRMEFYNLQELLQMRFENTVTNSMAVAAVQEPFPMVIMKASS